MNYLYELKGMLKNGHIVAVKVLSIEMESMRGEMEFVAELATMSRVKHENLVSLRGCCVEETRRYLVFEEFTYTLVHVLRVLS